VSDWLGPQEWAAVGLSLKVAFWAMMGAVVPGVFVAYALARWEFFGKQFVNVLVHSPRLHRPAPAKTRKSRWVRSGFGREYC